MSGFLQAVQETQQTATPATQEEIALEIALDTRLKERLHILRETLAKHSTARLVMVYDTTLGNPLGEAIAASGLPVVKPEIRNSEGLGQSVQLVDIDDAVSRHERLVSQSLRLALSETMKAALPQKRARSVCAWLITDESLARLKSCFEQRSRYPVSPSEHRILRFWDPRVTQHIGRLFPRHPPASWLPETVWLHIDSFGDWSALPAPEGGGTLETQPEGEMLAQISRINLTLQYLAAEGLRHDRRILPAVIE